MPFIELTKKGQPNDVKWTKLCQESFTTLKEKLILKPVLKFSDFKRQFTLWTDTSNTGIGEMLLQEHDGESFPVTYVSRKLSKREKDYSVIERECLAIVWSINKFFN